MKIQLLSLLVIAFIGIVPRSGEGFLNNRPPSPVVLPAFLGMNWFNNPLGINNNVGNAVNKLECRFSFAHTASEMREVFNALGRDVSTSGNRFTNSRVNQQLQQNIKIYFNDLQRFHSLTVQYISGQMYLFQYIRENFREYARLTKDITLGHIYLMRAGMTSDHLLPETHRQFRQFMNVVYEDITCLMTHPSNSFSYFSEMITFLMGPEILNTMNVGVGLGMGPLTPFSMLNYRP